MRAPESRPESRPFELFVNIHSIETADANTIKARAIDRGLPLPQDRNPKKVEARQTYFAGGDIDSGGGGKWHLKKQLEGSAEGNVGA